MLSVRAATFAAFAGLALVPALAKAQDTPPATTTPISLPPVTVSAGRGSDLEKLDVSTTVLTTCRSFTRSRPVTSSHPAQAPDAGHAVSPGVQSSVNERTWPPLHRDFPVRGSAHPIRTCNE